MRALVLVKGHLGNINISKRFFEQLIGSTLRNCFGVADINSASAGKTFLEALPIIGKKQKDGKGVAVKSVDGKLQIDLHITVMYGINISSVVKSIQHKIAYAVNEETDLEVEAVNVYVDGIKS